MTIVCQKATTVPGLSGILMEHRGGRKGC